GDEQLGVMLGERDSRCRVPGGVHAACDHGGFCGGPASATGASARCSPGLRFPSRSAQGGAKGDEMPRATWNGAVLAESDRCEVVEGNCYFPAEAVNRAHILASSPHQT